MKLSGRICFSLVAGAMVFAAAPAEANQVPRATYAGTTAAGGRISFDVSAQGGAITRFAWADVPTTCGTPITGRVSPLLSIPVVDHSFSLGPSGRAPRGFPVVSGSFPAVQQAAGSLKAGNSAGCGFSLAWTASTSAVAPPTPLTDEIPPTIQAEGGRDTIPGREFSVWVRCPEERCHTSLAGTVSVGGRAARAYLFGPQETYIEHGELYRLYVDLGQRAQKAVRRARRNRRRVTARITFTVSDPAGNSTVERFQIRLRRR